MASSRHVDDVKFNEILGEIIDETLSAILSRVAVNALYGHLRKEHGIGKDEIPYRLDLFFSQLETLFGEGAKTLSRALARGLFQKLGLEFPDSAVLTLMEYVEIAKQKIVYPPNR